MLTFKAALLAGLDLVLSGVATVTVLRAKGHLSRPARAVSLAAIWLVFAASLVAAALIGPFVMVGEDRSLQLMILWLAGLACFLEVAAVRAAADWKELEPRARRQRALSLGAMGALFVGFAAWSVLA